jgi:hypothetical protein
VNSPANKAARRSGASGHELEIEQSSEHERDDEQRDQPPAAIALLLIIGNRRSPN